MFSVCVCPLTTAFGKISLVKTVLRGVSNRLQMVTPCILCTSQWFLRILGIKAPHQESNTCCVVTCTALCVVRRHTNLTPYTPYYNVFFPTDCTTTVTFVRKIQKREEVIHRYPDHESTGPYITLPYHNHCGHIRNPPRHFLASRKRQRYMVEWR